MLAWRLFKYFFGGVGGSCPTLTEKLLNLRMPTDDVVDTTVELTLAFTVLVHHDDEWAW